MKKKSNTNPVQEAITGEGDQNPSSKSNRREFMTTSTAMVGGVAGLGALLAMAEDAGAAPLGAGSRSGPPELHGRELDSGTLLAIQRTGMELIAYAYGVEAQGELARGFLSIGRRCNGNGTTKTTCCHPEKTYSPDMMER